MKSAVNPEVWKLAQSGHLETWANFAASGKRDAPEREGFWREILAEVERRRPIAPEEVVLDIGCGLDTVLDFVTTKGRFTLDSLMAELARFGLSKGMCHTAAAFEQMPFPDACFDRVFLLNVLDHVRDPAQGLSEIARVLRPGGSFVLSVDTYRGRRYREKRLRKWYDRMRGARTKHPWVFSVRDTERLLARNGLVPEGAPTHIPGTKDRRTFFTATRR